MAKYRKKTEYSVVEIHEDGSVILQGVDETHRIVVPKEAFKEKYEAVKETKRGK